LILFNNIFHASNDLRAAIFRLFFWGERANQIAL